MRINESGGGPVHLAPFPDGPSVEVLVDDGVEGRQLASAKVTLAPGAAMPEHDHGESEALVISTPVSSCSLAPTVSSGSHPARWGTSREVSASGSRTAVIRSRR